MGQQEATQDVNGLIQPRAADVQFAFPDERPPLRLLSAIPSKLRRQGHRHFDRNRRSPSLECRSDRLAQHRPLKLKLPGQTPVGCEIDNQLPDSYTFMATILAAVAEEKTCQLTFREPASRLYWNGVEVSRKPPANTVLFCSKWFYFGGFYEKLAKLTVT